MIKLDKRFLQRIRIPLGFLFAIVFLIFSRPSAVSLSIGAGIALIGILIRAWASGHIRKARVLAVAGPYGYSRNPLYLGSFIMGLGFTIAAGVWWLALVFAALFIGIYLPVMRVEAGDMRHLFADDFDEYEQHVPLFFPRITSWKKIDGGFDFQLYLQYREYRAAIGAILAMAILAAKAFVLDRGL
jgi:protein-S-isoprenylcysteine O-methyltransferase Ste14